MKKVNKDILKQIFRGWSNWYNINYTKLNWKCPILLDGCLDYITINNPLAYYCGDIGVKINEYLRNGVYQKGGFNRNIEFAIYSGIISVLIQSAPKLKEDTIVYRYVSLQEKNEIIQKYPYIVGKSSPYLKPDFLSVTLNKIVEKDNSEYHEEYLKHDNILELTVLNGTPAIYPAMLKGCGREF